MRGADRSGQVGTEAELAEPTIGTEAELAEAIVRTGADFAAPTIGTEAELAEPTIGTEAELAEPTIGTEAEPTTGTDAEPIVRAGAEPAAGAQRDGYTPSPLELARLHRLIPTPRRSLEALPGGVAVVPPREPLEPCDSVRDPERARVLLRYARLMPSGRPVFCKPSRAELAGEVRRRQGPGSDGKVIYPDRESAEAAARELERLGARAQRAYVCKRSRRGHYHLTTDLVVERRRATAELPRQRDRRSA